MNHASSLPEVGRRLKEAAQEAGLTLRELGDRMGVSRPTIYAYASGALRMSAERVRQASEILDKPVSFFDPRSVEDLDPRSVTSGSLRLVEALMSPADPKKASAAAMDALESLADRGAPAIRAELLRRSGNALALSGDYVTAVKHLDDAIEAFREEDLADKVGACAQTLGVCYINLGRVDTALEHFSLARKSLPDVSRWKADVALAALAERIGRFDEAESLLSRILDQATLPETALAYVRANYASILAAKGNWKSALAQSETALKAAFDCRLPDQVSEMLVLGCSALTFMGRLEEATLMALRAKDVAFTLQDDARSTLAELAVAQLLAAFDEPEAARERATSAYSRALEGQYRRSESLALLLQAELAASRKDWTATYEHALQAKSHSNAYKYVVATSYASSWEAIALSNMGRADQAKAALAAAREATQGLSDGRPAVLLLEAESSVARLTDEEAADRLLGQAEALAEKLGLNLDAERIGQELARKGPQMVTGPHRIGDSAGSQEAGDDRAVWTDILLGRPLNESRGLLSGNMQ